MNVYLVIKIVVSAVLCKRLWSWHFVEFMFLKGNMVYSAMNTLPSSHEPPSVDGQWRHFANLLARLMLRNHTRDPYCQLCASQADRSRFLSFWWINVSSTRVQSFKLWSLGYLKDRVAMIFLSDFWGWNLGLLVLSVLKNLMFSLKVMRDWMLAWSLSRCVKSFSVQVLFLLLKGIEKCLLKKDIQLYLFQTAVQVFLTNHHAFLNKSWIFLTNHMLSTPDCRLVEVQNFKPFWFVCFLSCTSETLFGHK